ncbi:MAG TPA: hypothetical protein VGL34_10155, partial [Steroidobacteraceae bacterium]
RRTCSILIDVEVRRECAHKSVDVPFHQCHDKVEIARHARLAVVPKRMNTEHPKTTELTEAPPTLPSVAIQDADDAGVLSTASRAASTLDLARLRIGLADF